MALTAEDVVNKRFSATKFREGYDQDEVDDFLDEVVVELRRLGQENDELRQQLGAVNAQLADAQRAAPVASEPVAAPPAPAHAPEAASAGFVGGDLNPNDPNSTNNLLQLARRLHEEHVREGIEKRDALIAEGHATAARLVNEAESQQRAELSGLEQQKVQLERRIDELRTFEREYRSKLRGHIEGLLHDLDSANAPAAAPSAPAPAPAAAAAPAPQGPAVPGFGQPQGQQPPASFPGFGGS